jgi:predicted nuclease with TOPRIM domain
VLLRSKSLITNLIIPLTTVSPPPPCEMCGSLKGKLFHATKENTKLKQEVDYLTSRLERTVVSEKMIEFDLSRVEESATKFTYKLGVGFEKCEDKGEKSAPSLFLAPTTTRRRKQSNPPKLITHPIQSHHSTPREK